jgi:methionyl-tRNA formyltransferase
MGTGPFAVPMFRAILESPHPVLALVTRPDRPAHRRERVPVNPMRDMARERAVEIFESDSINSAESQAWLREKTADLFVVCDYGQILSRETLALASHGGINLHASLLPKYRGAAPINWAIYHGESETGITVIHMTPQLDAGPALVQTRTPIGPAESAPELEARLAQLGVAAVLKAIDILASGDEAGVSQDQSAASTAPRLKKEDGLVDWSRTAKEIFDQVRGLEPWPKTHTFWQRPGHEPVRLILERVEPMAAILSDSGGIVAGTIIQADAQGLVVACGEGALRVQSLQPAGKRAMSAGEFLRGHPLKVRDRLG